MATYQSAYTGAQIDAGVAQSTVYTYDTVLTGASGTINSATDLVAAMNAKAPLIFKITSNTNTVTFYHAYSGEASSSIAHNYVGLKSISGLTQDIYNLYLTANGTTVSWNLYETDIPIPDTADNGSLMKVASGQYALSTGLPYTTTAPSAANTDGLKIVVTSQDPSTKYSGYLYIVSGS